MAHKQLVGSSWWPHGELVVMASTPALQAGSTGSTPVFSTIWSCSSVEERFYDTEEVEGSIPSETTGSAISRMSPG